MKQFLVSFLDDLLLVLGCLCILYGLSMWNVIATWICAGMMLIGFGWMIAKAKAQNVTAKPVDEQR